VQYRYIECSLLYKLGRIDRLPMEYKADALEFGTVMHIVLGGYYYEKMIGNKMLLKDIHQSFENHWTRVAKGRKDIKYAKGKDFETLLMNGKDLLTAWYMNLKDDNYTVLSIEEAFCFNIPGIDVPIIGATDLREPTATVRIKVFNRIWSYLSFMRKFNCKVYL